MKRIAITGAAGSVGSALRHELAKAGKPVRLIDVKQVVDVRENEDFVLSDVRDRDGNVAALQGCGSIVHLASCTTDAPWAEQVSLTVEGTTALLDAAHECGIRRLVCASSHHVVGMYPRTAAPLRPDVTVRPDSRYAVAKAFQEAACALYAIKYDMQVLVIRIGNVADRPIDRRRLGNWLSPEDLGQLVGIGLEHPSLVYEVVYGISDRSGRHYDNSGAFALGYDPTGDPAGFERLVARTDPAPPAGSAQGNSVHEMSLGGQWADDEYVGEAARIRY